VSISSACLASCETQLDPSSCLGLSSIRTPRRTTPRWRRRSAPLARTRAPVNCALTDLIKHRAVGSISAGGLKHGGWTRRPPTGAPSVVVSVESTRWSPFYLRLLEQLQQVGTVTAMELEKCQFPTDSGNPVALIRYYINPPALHAVPQPVEPVLDHRVGKLSDQGRCVRDLLGSDLVKLHSGRPIGAPPRASDGCHVAEWQWTPGADRQIWRDWIHRIPPRLHCPQRA
jgi:hypothetical protein